VAKDKPFDPKYVLRQGLTPRDYFQFSEDDKTKYRAEFDGDLQGFELTYPLKNNKHMQSLVRSAVELSFRHPHSRIYSLGSSPQWFVATAEMMDLHPERFGYIPFSGNWYQLETRDLRDPFDNRPKDDMILHYRTYLEKIGLHPLDIAKRSSPTVIVEYVEGGRSLMSFVKGALLEWAQQMNCGPEFLEKLRLCVLSSSDEEDEWEPTRTLLAPFRELGFIAEVQCVSFDLLEEFLSQDDEYGDRFVPRFYMANKEIPTMLPLSRRAALVCFRILDYLYALNMRNLDVG